jgi:hypothetical protein
MEFDKNGNFKVGNTSLSTPVEIRIPEYGYELPEINSSSPIPMPMYTSVSNIINWLERGINVEFINLKDRERVFFFILDYNRFIQKENKAIEDPDEQYRPAVNAEQILLKAIDFTSYINKRAADEKIPFKKKPFKGRIRVEHSGQASSPRTKNKMFAGMKQSDREVITPNEVRAYDLFSQSPNIGIISRGPFDDIELD